MTVEELISLLEQLGEKLTPPAQHVFELAARQVVLDGVFNAIVAMLALIGIPVLWRLASVFVNRAAKSLEGTWNERGDVQATSVLIRVASVATIAFVLIPTTLGGFGAALNYLLNPEYWTLLRLAEFIK